MASALSNTHASLFTQFPKCVTKTWESKPIAVSTSESINVPLRKHESSLIEQVEIKIVFADLPESDVVVFDETDDMNEDKFEAWQEGKKQWGVIDAAVSDGIQQIRDMILSSAKKRKTESVAIPKHIRTTYSKQKAKPATAMSQPHNNHISKRDIDSLAALQGDIRGFTGYAETLSPLDSVSRVQATSNWSNKVAKTGVSERRLNRVRRANTALNILSMASTMPHRPK